MGRNNQPKKEPQHIRTHSLSDCHSACPAEISFESNYYKSLLRKMGRIFDNIELTQEQNEFEMALILDAYSLSVIYSTPWDPETIRQKYYSGDKPNAI